MSRKINIPDFLWMVPDCSCFPVICPSLRRTPTPLFVYLSYWKTWTIWLWSEFTVLYSEFTTQFTTQLHVEWSSLEFILRTIWQLFWQFDRRTLLDNVSSLTSVENSLLHTSDHLERCPRTLEALGRHARCSGFDTLTTSSTHWRQWRGCCTSFRHGLHGPVGMVSYAHAVYVICYFCYIFSLGPSSASTGSVQIYRSACQRHWPNIYRCIPT